MRRLRSQAGNNQCGRRYPLRQGEDAHPLAGTSAGTACDIRSLVGQAIRGPGASSGGGTTGVDEGCIGGDLEIDTEACTTGTGTGMC